jgi:hypothetical protein
MTLQELKQTLLTKTIPTDFMIFVSKDNSFLASQYIKEIKKLATEGVNKINSIYEPQQSSVALLTTTENAINILTVETFDERAEDYNQFENTIVVCEQVDKSIAKNVEPFIIKFPKLEEWQIMDYAKTICPNVEETDLSWLLQATNNNVERIVNELEKVALFPKEAQQAIFSAIRFDPQTDLFDTDLFKVVNALVEGDLTVLYEFIKHNGYEEIEPVVLANRTLTSLKNIILITQNPGITAEDCGVSAGQFRFLKYKYHSLNIEVIRQKIKFLTAFDLKLKTSKLDLNKREMLNYLITNLSGKITL